MNRLIPLTEFRERVHEWAIDNFDVRADSKEFLYHDVQDIEVQEKVEPFGRLSTRLELTDHSRGQLCERFKLPAGFMFNDKYFPPELRKDCFDFKFRSMPQDDMIIRGRQFEEGPHLCRAVLTHQYRPYDNTEFVDAVVEAVTVKGVDPSTVRVGNYSIGDETRGFCVLPNITFDQWNGGSSRGPSADGGGSGGLHPGFKIGNSEIGTMMIRIAGGTWRNYCDNGQVFGWNTDASFKQVHRGQKVLSLLVNEAIADALYLSEKGAQNFIEKMALKVEKTDIGAIIDQWSSQYGMTVESTDAWRELVVTESRIHGEISEFDMINGLTYIARNTEDVEEQELLQVVAGDMTFHDSVERGLLLRR